MSICAHVVTGLAHVRCVMETSGKMYIKVQLKKLERPLLLPAALVKQFMISCGLLGWFSLNFFLELLITHRDTCGWLVKFVGCWIVLFFGTWSITVLLQLMLRAGFWWLFCKAQRNCCTECFRPSVQGFTWCGQNFLRETSLFSALSFSAALDLWSDDLQLKNMMKPSLRT